MGTPPVAVHGIGIPKPLFGILEQIRNWEFRKAQKCHLGTTRFLKLFQTLFPNGIFQALIVTIRPKYCFFCVCLVTIGMVKSVKCNSWLKFKAWCLIGIFSNLLSQMILQKTTNHQHQSMPNGLGLGLTFHSPSLTYIDQLYRVPPR